MVGVEKQRNNKMSTVHVMFNGESIDMSAGDLDIGDLSSDSDIRSAVAGSLDVPVSKLASYSIDKNEDSGDITLRPQATFGSL